MNWRFCEIAALLLITTIMITPMIPAVHSQDLVAYPLQSAVNMDGRFSSTNEWNDVEYLELGIGMMEGAAYFGAKYDANYLYTMWDFVRCTKPFNGNQTSNPNQIFIYLNPSNKVASALDNSMYRVFVFSGTQTPYLSRGTSDGKWTESNPSSSSDLSARVQYSSSPHLSFSHLVVELRIALTFGDIKSYMVNGIGAAIGFYDGKSGSYAGYPSRWRSMEPDTWSTLELSSVPVPEFSMIVLPLLAAMILPLFIVRSSPRQKRGNS